MFQRSKASDWTMVREDWRWLGGTVLALILVVMATMLSLHVTGALDSADQNHATRLGAVLTFIAAMVTAALSVVGLIVKRQSDRRTAAQSADERERLRLEAAMRAGSLFASTDKGSPGPASVASGLLALTQLDRSDLAVALLVDLWHPGTTDSVSTETAILVLNAALGSDDPGAQLIAAELLGRNCRRLNACQALHWPSVIDGRWRADFGLKTKILLVDALVTMTVTTDPSQNALRSVTLRLYGIWFAESDRVKRCISRLICALIPALERLGYTDFIQDPHPVSLGDLRLAAQDGFGNPDGLLERITTDRRDKLASWASDCRITDISPGGSDLPAGDDGNQPASDIETGSSTMVGVA